MGLNHRPADYESAALPLSYVGSPSESLNNWQDCRTKPMAILFTALSSVNLIDLESFALSRHLFSIKTIFADSTKMSLQRLQDLFGIDTN